MSSVNRVILVGRLGADPELRHTQSGQPVCGMRLATNEVWNDRDGQRQERTEWHTVSVWGKQGESCGQHLFKGRNVYVEGRLQSREYTDNQGVERKVWEVNASRVVFLSDGGTTAARRPSEPTVRGHQGGRSELADQQPSTGNWSGGSAPAGAHASQTAVRDAQPNLGFDDNPIPF